MKAVDVVVGFAVENTRSLGWYEFGYVGYVGHVDVVVDDVEEVAGCGADVDFAAEHDAGHDVAHLIERVVQSDLDLDDNVVRDFVDDDCVFVAVGATDFANKVDSGDHSCYN